MAATLKTEDTGKMFEMAICLAYGIPYDGKYKYDMVVLNAELVMTLQQLMTRLFILVLKLSRRGAVKLLHK
jgi:hypothetical protein